MQIKLRQDTSFIEDLSKNLSEENNLSSWELFQLSYHTVDSTITRKFSGLNGPKLLPHVNFLTHQLACAQQVVEEMNGRAILADEVGLGKTIEAGLILKEYMLRGLVKKALILVPASLVNQWGQELAQKFYIPAVTARKKPLWDQQDIMITSIDTAKRDPHRDKILSQDYDFVLVDEAHKLKNSQTKNYQFVRSLKKKYCLLLTATPIQNKLTDIFNLVSILKPGFLGDYESFSKKFNKKNRNAEDDQYLKRLIQKVMVRNRREDTNIKWTKRKVETIYVDFTNREADVYQKIEKALANKSRFSSLVYLRELCSSREACFLSLKKDIEQETDHNAKKNKIDLLHEIEQLPQHAKAIEAVELVKSINDKCIIFTEYRATQVYLQWLLQQHGIKSVPFRGGFKRGKKDWMKQLFENQVQVMIATEAGGEGINLQFCSHLINYDLPWNPMRLEQRIGRIHRFGQKEDVHIYNFAIRNTIEDHVLQLLYKKIQLFERVIGNLDAILADLKLSNFEDEISSILAESHSAGEIKVKMNNLAAVIAQAQSLNEKEQKNGNRESS
ncbi:SNF2 family DNA or RNA helicase [Natronobacillus azotifigens]|uniref:SNF2-related protein n=1 Tax=Natronobacillus azotifigens TaxID=472978 RepID=A0A9J6REA3_9BACI|nr:SNF2-related protein [Natronobacillus azotifigens]MCZ0704074.1 SNF2-related protein [Natronobacillus azotifigens]